MFQPSYTANATTRVNTSDERSVKIFHVPQLMFCVYVRVLVSEGKTIVSYHKNHFHSPLRIFFPTLVSLLLF